MSAKHYDFKGLLRPVMYLLPLLMIPVLTFISCKDDDDKPEPPVNSVTFQLSYHVDNEPLVFDTLRYQNKAGNLYSVTRLQYYISNLVFLRQGGEEEREIVQYVDAEVPSSNTFHITGLPQGTYTGLRFLVGLNKEKNKTGALPGTQENVNMAWPDPMGGGYHFMKLEGHFTNGGAPVGYAVHLGRDTALVHVNINQTFTIGQSTTLKLAMNLNKWYETPNEYDLADGNYTMGSIPNMLLIAANGNDVFTIPED